jgi:hypothetical protein
MRMKSVYFVFSLTMISLLPLSLWAQIGSQDANDRLYTAKTSAPALIATEEEVRQFFATYIEKYNRKDLEGFLALFSSKAVQNQRDGLEGIQKNYSHFFNQSIGIRYRIDDVRIEIYQNGVEVKANYEVNQIMEKRGEEKIWKGPIRWTLIKEDGALKILSLDYQQQKSP